MTDPHDLSDLLRPTTLTPEHVLMLAIFDDAQRCALLPENKACRSSRRWIESRETEYVFSFAMICMAFNREPDTIRRKIMERSEYKIPPTTVEVVRRPGPGRPLGSRSRHSRNGSKRYSLSRTTMGQQGRGGQKITPSP